MNCEIEDLFKNRLYRCHEAWKPQAKSCLTWVRCDHPKESLQPPSKANADSSDNSISPWGRGELMVKASCLCMRFVIVNSFGLFGFCHFRDSMWTLQVDHIHCVTLRSMRSHGFGGFCFCFFVDLKIPNASLAYDHWGILSISFFF